MNPFIFICFVVIVCYSSYPSKVKKLQKDVKSLKRKIGGGTEMSKLISNLIGQSCQIILSDGVHIVESTIIMDADDEWVKIEKTTKKGVKSVEVIRIDDIKKITFSN